MDGGEVFVFLIAIAIAAVFFIRWYIYVLIASSFKKIKLNKYTLGIMPLVCVAIILVALIFWAAPDVEGVFLAFYIILGFTWIYLGISLLFILFDLSWIDDVLNHNNKSALYAICGAILGFALIYSGSNVGDGPGWWCVVFTCLLGFITWSILGVAIKVTTKIFYRITVERDLYAGLRLALYFIASGIIIGRACAGDWTSFEATMSEFLDVWPVFPLTALMIGFERYFIYREKHNDIHNKSGGVSLILLAGIGAFYIALAIASIIWFLPAISINNLR